MRNLIYKILLGIYVFLNLFLTSLEGLGQSCTGSLGDPVVNQTYGSGPNPGAALGTGQTTYTHVSSDCPNDGFYGIRNSTGTNTSSTCFGNSWHYLPEDHTPGDVNGYMMVVNASYTVGEFFKQNISGLCGGTTYQFSAWVVNLLKTTACLPNPARPNLTFSIETTSGTVLKTYNTGVISESNFVDWKQYATFFTTPTGVSTVVLRIINNAPGGCGNDLALDDIQFRACGPTISTSISNTKVCLGQSITLTGNISSGYNNPVYQWQRSSDQGTTWTNISGATSLNYSFTPSSSGIYYYRLLASENGNINLVTCRIASTPIVNAYVTPYPDLVSSGGSVCFGKCVDLSTLFTDQTTTLSGSTVTIKYYNTLADAQGNVGELASSTVCPTSSRSYFVSKTVNGCNDIVEIPITVIPLPVVSPTSNTPVCVGSNLNFSTTNAGTGATYQWIGPNSFNQTTQNPSITSATSAAGGIYTLTVTLNGCTATATTSVIIKPLPTVGTSSNSPVCQGQTLNLAAVNGGTGASYLWNGPNSFSSTSQNPSISNVSTAASGVYTSTVTLNGCTATSTTNVSIKALPNTTASSNSPVCIGSTINLVANNGITGVSYQWNGPNSFSSASQNPSITNATNAAAGIYTLTVLVNGCTITSTTNVAINALPIPTASSNTPVCVGKSLDLTSSGGTTYAWTGPNGFSSSLQNPSVNPVSALATGIYTVTVTNANGCSATATTNVVINALPIPTASSNTPVCVGKSLDLTSSGGTTYAWIGPNGFNSSLQNPSINPVSALSTGIYTVTVTNANGCSATATTSVLINALPTPTANSNTPVCVGKSLDLTSSGGTAYAWSGPNGFNSSLQNPSINPVSALSTGVYTVTVTNANGCSATATTSVLINVLPIPTASSNTPVCVGKSLDLTSSGGTAYAWTGPNGFGSSLQNPSISPVSALSTGVYTVTVTNANGCSATATTNVLINVLPIPTATSNTPVCVGKSLDLTSSGGTAYAWTGPNGFGSSLQNPSISPVSALSTGVYTVTVSNANGCSATATTNVLINVLPIPTANSNTPVCVGKSLDLTSSGGTTYAWTGPNGFGSSLQNPSINPVSALSTGVYTVTVTNANGCSATATTNVLINVLPIPTATSNTPVCVGKSLDLSSSGGTTYAWTGPNGFSSSLQNPSISPVSALSTGVYTVTVTNANGCSATATTSVVINALPIPTANSNTPVCVGKSLDLTSSGGTTYAWTGPNGFSSSLQNPSINPVSALSTGVYTVTVTNANGCSATATTNVLINVLPIPTANSNTPVCVGKSLDLSSSGGTTYAWTGPNGFLSSLQNPSINPVSALSTGVYTVTVTNANGCSATATTNVLINVLPIPTATSNTPVCVGKSLDLSSSGGTTYAWTGPNGFSSSLQNPSISPVSALSTGVYTVTVTNANGCSATATTSVVINALPIPTANSNTPVCVGKSLDLTSSGGTTYAWTGPNGFSSSLQNPSINPVSALSTGVYTVTVTNANGCSATATTNVLINVLPIPTANSNTPVCVGKSLDLSSSGGTTYAWTGPNGFLSSLQNPSINPVSALATGVYTVTVTNANGCSATATTSVFINALPTPTASSNTPVCVGKSLDLTSSGGTTYAWTGPNGFSSSLQNPSINPASALSTGIYTVTVTNANGCSATATTSVLINALPIPTAHSNTPVCIGKSLDLTSSGGTAYAWTGPNGFNSSLQNPSINPVSALATGVYTVTVTNANACSATATTSVVINALPTPTANSNTPVCVDKSLDLTSSGGTAYAWSGPNGFSSSLQNPSINPVSASATGIYTVTVTNANGCSATATTNVQINVLPIPTANSNTPVCVGKSLDLTSSGGTTYAWTGPNGFSSSLQNPSINPVSALSTGVYTVTVTNANGCSATATTNVVINTLPIPTANSNTPVCVGKSLDLTSSGGTAYAWSGPNSFSSSLQNPSINPVSASATGVYTVTVTNANGCSATATTNVVINFLPTPTASSNTPVCVGKSLDLTSSGGTTYAWAGPNGFSSSLQNPSINPVSALSTGVYTVTVTNANGCSATATTNVVINALPIPTASSNTPVCVGKSLDLTSSGGTAYAWTGPNGFSSSLQNPSINPVSASATGVYTVTVTNANGCSASATTNVVINVLPVAVVSSNSPVCETLPLNISAQSSIGAVYSWTGPNGFTSTVQNPTISSPVVANSGGYFLTVTSGDGCTATASTNIVIKIKPVATASNDSPKCAGQTLSLTSTNELGAVYSWSGPNGFTSNLQNPTISNVSPINSGVYQVIVDLDGCFNSATTNVVVYDNPVANPISNTPVCEQQPLNFTAESAGVGAVYSWIGPNSFSSTLQNPSIGSPTVLASGIYTLSVTKNACFTTATTEVVVKPKPTVSIPSVSPLCATETLNLQANATTGVTYNWSGPNGFVSTLQNPSFSNAQTNATGLYEVIVDLNGCLNSATTSVVVNPKPDATAMANSPVCETETVNFSANNAGASATYLWVGPNGYNSTQQNPSLNNTIPSQSGVYTLTVTLGICTSTATTAILVNPKATMTIGTVACKPNLKTYSVALNTSAAVVLTTAGTVNALGGTNYSIDGIPAGTDIIITIKTDKDCIASQPVTAPDCSCPIVNAPISGGNVVICEGEATPNLSANVLADETVDWYATPSGGTPLEDSTTTYKPLPTTAGVYTYYAQTRNIINECVSSTRTAIVFTIKPTPQLTINSNSPICENDTLKLFGTSTLQGVTYNWTGVNGFTSTQQNPVLVNASPSQSGFYKLIIDLAGCKSSDSLNVTIKPKPQPIINSNSPVCEGFPFIISANTIPNASYKWTGVKAFTSENQNEIITNTIPACSGIYTLTVTLNGCVNTATTNIVVNAKPSITSSATQCSVDLASYSLKFTATGGTVTTSLGTIVGDSVKNIPSGADVKLLITSPEGCQDSLLVKAPDCLCPVLYAPVSQGDTAICQNTQNPALEVLVNTANGETVDWYDAPNGGTLLQANSLAYTPIPTQPGTYTYYAETRRGDITIRTCVSSTRTAIKLIIKPLPIASATNNSPICDGDSLKLNAGFVSGANFSWSGPNGFIANSEDTLRLSATTNMSGIYTVTVNLDGCVSTATTEVLVKPLPDALAMSNANAGVCEKDTIVLFMPNGGTIDSYTWTGPNLFTSTGQTTKISPASPSQSGIYVLQTTLNGCKNQDTTQVLVKPLPITIANNTSPVCEGDSVVLSAADSPNASYEWFNPVGVSIGTGKNLVLNNTLPSQSGNYFVKVTSNGCSDSSFTQVIIKRKPIAIATGNTICSGETIQLSAQKDSTSTYQWTGPLGFTSSAKDTTINTASISQSGVYILNVTLNGCSVEDTANVVVKPLPLAVALSNSPVCEASKIQLTAENAGIDAIYSWTGPNGFTSTLQNPEIDNASMLSQGIYTLSVLLNGCLKTDTIKVEVKPLPDVVITANTPLCEGDTLRLTVAEVLGASYAWSGSNNFTSNQQKVNINNVSVSSSGIYQVTVTLNACSKNDSIAILVKPKPLAEILSNSPVCENDTLKLTAANAGVGATYAWTGPNGFTSTEQNPSIAPIVAANAGQYILKVTLDDCIETDTAEIVVKPLPILQLTSNSPLCSGDTLKLFSGNTQVGTSFKWSGVNFTDSTSNPQIYNVNVSQSGIYQVTALLNGCFKADSLNINIKPLPDAIATAKFDSLCVGETLELSVANAGIGATYAWIGPNGFVSQEQNPVINNVTQTNSGTYTLQATLNGCSKSDSIKIVINPLPVLVIDSAKCSPDLKFYSIYYHASDSSTATSSAGIIETGIIRNIPIDSLTTTVTLTSKYGCSVSQMVNAPDCNCPVIAAPILNVKDTTICAGNTLPIFKATVGSRETVDWYDAPVGSNKIFTGLNYTLSKTDTLYLETRDTVSNCKSSIRVAISLKINELPVFNLSSNSPICEGDTLKLNSTEVVGGSYSWTSNNGFSYSQQNPIITNISPNQAGTYILQATLNGCSKSDSIKIVINPLPVLVIDSAKCTPDLKFYSIYYHASDSSNVTSSAGIIETGIIRNVPIDSLTTTVTLTSKYGCSVSQIVNAPNCNCPVIAAPILNVKDTTICAGNILPIFKATVGSRETVDWYDAPIGGNKIFTGLSYTLPKTDTLYLETRDTVSNCKSSVRVAISLKINELPVFNLSSNSPICEGDTLKLNSTEVVGGSYSWTNSNGFSSSQQNPIIKNISPNQAGYYTLQATLNGCSKSDSLKIVVNPLPVLVIDSAKCTQDLKFYNIYFHASDSSTVTSSAGIIETGVIRNVPIDSLTTTVTLTSKYSCSVSQIVNAPNCNCPVIAAPILNVKDTTICAGNTLPIFKATVGSRETVDWYDAPIGGNKIFTGLSYTLTKTDTLYLETRDTVSNCKSSVRVAISLKINELPVFNLSSNSPICEGDTLKLNSTEVVGGSYSWTNNNGFSSSQQNPIIKNISPNQAGYFKLQATLNGCSKSDSIKIVVNPLPVLVIDSAKCTPDLKFYSIYYHASDSSNVTSSAGIIETGIVRNVPIDSLTTTVTLTSKYGCSVSQIVNAPDCNCSVIVAPILNVKDTTICAGNILPILKATVGSRETVDWYDAQVGGNKIFTGLSYTLTKTDTLYLETRDTVSNCKSSVRVAISLKINELPSFDLKATPATCSGSVANKNGKIEIQNLAFGDRFDYGKGSSYVGTATYQTASVIPANGLIISNVLNLSADEMFTIRVFNSSGCYFDKTVILGRTACDCLPDICVPFVVKKTKSRIK